MNRFLLILFILLSASPALRADEPVVLSMSEVIDYNDDTEKLIGTWTIHYPNAKGQMTINADGTVMYGQGKGTWKIEENHVLITRSNGKTFKIPRPINLPTSPYGNYRITKNGESLPLSGGDNADKQVVSMSDVVDYANIGKPVVLALSDVQDLSNRVGGKALRPQMVARLVRDYNCVILSRSSPESLFVESQIFAASDLSKTSSLQDNLAPADYVIRAHILSSPNRGSVRVFVEMKDITEDVDKETIKVSLEVPIVQMTMGGKRNHDNVLDTIIEEVSTRLKLKRIRRPKQDLAETPPRSETWAVLPFIDLNSKHPKDHRVAISNLETKAHPKIHQESIELFERLYGSSNGQIRKKRANWENARRRLAEAKTAMRTVEPQKIDMTDAILIESLLQEKGVVSRIVDRASIEKILNELKLKDMFDPSADLAGAIGRLVGADHLVLGYTLKEQKGVRVILHLVDTKTSEVVNATEALAPTKTDIETALSLAVDSLKNASPIKRKEFEPAQKWQREREARFHFTRYHDLAYGSLEADSTLLNRLAVITMLVGDDLKYQRTVLKGLLLRLKPYGFNFSEADYATQMLDYILKDESEPSQVIAPMFININKSASVYVSAPLLLRATAHSLIHDDETAMKLVRKHIALNGQQHPEWIAYIGATKCYREGNLIEARSLIEKAIDVQQTGKTSGKGIGWSMMGVRRKVTALALRIAQDESVKDEDLEYKVLQAGSRSRYDSLRFIQLTKKRKGVEAALKLYSRGPNKRNRSYDREKELLAADLLVEIGNIEEAKEIYTFHSTTPSGNNLKLSTYAIEQLKKLGGPTAIPSSLAPHRFGRDIAPFPDKYKVYCFPVSGVRKDLMTKICKRFGKWFGTEVIIKNELPRPAGAYDTLRECYDMSSYSRQLLQNAAIPEDAVFVFFFTGDAMSYAESRCLSSVMPKLGNPVVISHYYQKRVDRLSEDLVATFAASLITEPPSISWGGWARPYWKESPCYGRGKPIMCSGIMERSGICSFCQKSYNIAKLDQCHASLHAFLKGRFKNIHWKEQFMADQYKYGTKASKKFGWRETRIYPGNPELDEELFERKMQSLITKAESGDAHTQGLLGSWYESGERGLLRNYEKALKWATLSANQKHPLGLYALACLYREGKGLIGDEDQAESLFKASLGGMQKLAEQGDPEAQCNLGHMFEHGYGVLKDVKQAVQWYKKAAEQNNARGLYSFAVMNEWGRGVGKNEAEALKLHRKSAEMGHAPAQLALAHMLLFRATKGYGHAPGTRLALVKILLNGLGTEKDLKECMAWTRKAASQGSPSALYWLGYMHCHGLGTEKPSAIEAEKYFRQAISLGDYEAVKELGGLYQWGAPPSFAGSRR